MENIERVILHNSIKCLKCEEEIASKHRHDFVMCKCGSVGGWWKGLLKKNRK